MNLILSLLSPAQIVTDFADEQRKQQQQQMSTDRLNT